MSEQDFLQCPEEGDAEEAPTFNPSFIFDRGEEEDVDRDEETAVIEVPLVQVQTMPLAQAETVLLASRISLMKTEEPSPVESRDFPTQAPSTAHAEGPPHTGLSASPVWVPSTTHAESLPLTEPSVSLTQASPPTQMEETSDEPEAPGTRDSSIATGEQTVASGSSAVRPEPRTVPTNAMGVSAVPTGTALSSTVSKSPLSDAPVSSSLPSTSDIPPLSPTSASSHIVSLLAASPIFETPSSPSVLEAQSVGNEGAMNSSSPSTSAPPGELAESIQAAVHSRNRQSDNESAPVLARSVLAGEQPPTGEEVRLSGEITPGDDVVGESVPVVTGQIETVTPGSRITATPVVAGETPTMTQIDPTPTPRNVFAHRVKDEDGEAESFEELENVEEGASLSEPPDETSVQCRSFINPSADLNEPEPEALRRPREDIGEQAIEELGAPATPYSPDDTIFDGASIQAEVLPRTGAHWASLSGYLLLMPLAWLLTADSGVRLTLNDAGSVVTGNFAPLPFLGLLDGLVLVLFLSLLARKPSLDPWFVGTLTTLVGLPSLIVPGLTTESPLPYLRTLSSSGTFSQSLDHHAQASAYSGRPLLAGPVLMGTGSLSHSVCHISWNEELLRAEIERINPMGAYFTVHTRRRAAKAVTRF